MIGVTLTLRALTATLLAAGALAPALAAADTSVVTPGVTVGAVTVPSVTVPSVTVPSVSTPPVDVPPVSTPVGSTPPVHVPSISTPVVTTPPVRTPPVSTPPVHTPPVTALPGTPVAAGAPVARRDRGASPAPAPAAPVPASAANAPAPGRPGITRRTRLPRTTASRRQTHRARTAPRRRATTPVALRRPTTPRSDTRQRPRPQAAVPAVALAPPSRRSLLPGTVQELVDALPRWVIAAILGSALIAMLMAINAYLSSRRARALGVQRAALIDDVGLLQTALLAPVPAHAGDAQVSVAYRPAAGPAAGGDFYDVITLGPARTGLLLGDVSGHGRDAVRDAALVRYTVRTFLAAGHDPADALARADACLGADLDGRFATVIAAVYDHDAHTLRYAKAGHHPPVVLGTTHDPNAEPVAPPLGAGLGIHPEVSEVTLDRGSTVCLFTDGLIEARRDGALLGRESLVEFLTEGRPDGPELLDRVVERADEVPDDLAVCVLRRP
jgi:hypothetical protein